MCLSGVRVGGFEHVCAYFVGVTLFFFVSVGSLRPTYLIKLFPRLPFPPFFFCFLLSLVLLLVLPRICGCLAWYFMVLSLAVVPSQCSLFLFAL